jgi:hypothetical protein
MAAVPARFWRRQVLVEMNEAPPGDVRLRVGSAARPGVGEIVPAVADNPVCIVEVRGQVGDGDEYVTSDE